MNVGAPELLIVLLVVLLIFGGAKLPQLARSLGQAKSEFEKGVRGDAPSSKSKAASAQQVDKTSATDAGDTVTLSRAELERLIDERVRDATDGTPEPKHKG